MQINRCTWLGHPSAIHVVMFERFFLVKSYRYCVYKRSFLLPAREVVEKSDYVRKKHMRDFFLTGLGKFSSFEIAFCALSKIFMYN